MANSSIQLSSLDFDTLKDTFKQYMKTQSRFADYDFEGSNMNVLLDILAYNTFHNAFYLNMIGNEMFLDSSQLRSSVVSHAKELNYVPKSFTSATANVNITVTSNQVNERSVLITKDTPIVAYTGNRTFIFSTGENIIMTDFTINNNNITFVKENITIYEGSYYSDSFNYTRTNTPRMIISNKNVDISSIDVVVVEDAGATTHQYTRALSLFDIDSESKVYFIQAAGEDTYEIIFGDGISGRMPKDNSAIIVQYRICNGELPNGTRKFKIDPVYVKVGNYTGTASIFVNAPAAGGSVHESLESIKFNAPRAFTTQERAVTAEDYENLLLANFPEINVVSAFGGEDLDPPQYGKVFVSVDLNDVDVLPEIKKNQYNTFLKSRSPTSIQPVFISPEYTYIDVQSLVKYNVRVSTLTLSDIETIVLSNILNYSSINLNGFNKTFRNSKLVSAVDSSHSSIVSSETNIRLIKRRTPEIAIYETYDIDFTTPLEVNAPSSNYTSCVRTTPFSYNNIRVYMKDDGAGVIGIYSENNDQFITSTGTVNYSTGLIQISNLRVTGFDGPTIKYYVVPRQKDINTTKNVILNILEEDISVTAVPARV